jgi:flavin-dependent dehydrogenase
MGKVISINSVQNVPLIFDVDVLIVGGRLAGVAAAREAAQGGSRVVLIESETYLGYEFGAWQRPWIQWRRESADMARAWLPVEMVPDECADGQHVPLHTDHLKVKLEDRLLECGVQILYVSRPVAYRREGEQWLVVIGNKSGRQAIRARYLVDATEHGAMACLSGPGKTSATGEVVRRTVEFTGVTQEEIQQYPVPVELGVIGDSVTVYPGAFSKDHVYVDVAIRQEAGRMRSLESDTQTELTSRAASLLVAEHLTGHVPAFAKAVVGWGSLRAMQETGFDAATALALGEEFGRAIARGDARADHCHRLGPTGREELSLPDHFEAAPTGSSDRAPLSLAARSAFAEYWAGEVVPTSLANLAVLTEVDVAVIGGGTSGAPAAYTAAREDVAVAVMEMNSRLGGTGTLGAICEHWMSTPNAFNDEVDRRVEQWEDRLRFPIEARRWETHRRRSSGERYLWGGDGHWSVELKAHVLEEMCREAGASVYFDSLLIGTLVEGDAVVGAVVATPYGPRAVLANVTVDATGDGDVAAFAGAEYVYGNARDRQTMFTALAFYRTPGGIGNNHIVPADIEDVFDYTRFILTSRRRGKGLHDHGTYVAPRETRHIVGEATVSLEDQLLLTSYPDTVAVLFSNWDMKGQWFADIVEFGINPPHEDIEIPYRALLPQRLEQLLIAGKAFSLTHDACAAPRMQRDLILLGGAVGLAAAFAIENDVSPRQLDVAALQRRLVESGNLYARILEYAPSPAADLPALVAGLTGDEPLEWQEMLAEEKATSVSPIIRLCCAEPSETVPLLRQAFRESSGKRQLLLARLLLWHGADDGADVVVAEADRQLASCTGPPPRVGQIFWSTGSPEQAIQPETIFLVNNLVRVGDRRVLRVLQTLVDRIDEGERDYTDIRAGIYDYVRAVAVAAERLTWPEFVPLLERLSNLPEIKDAVFPRGLNLDYFRERRSYLVLYLARALARCGRKDGLLRLADLLAEPRALLSGSAHQELRALTSLDLPKDRDRWAEALQSWPDTFPAQPWEKELT